MGFDIKTVCEFLLKKVKPVLRDLSKDGKICGRPIVNQLNYSENHTIGTEKVVNNTDGYHMQLVSRAGSKVLVNLKSIAVY